MTDDTVDGCPAAVKASSTAEDTGVCNASVAQFAASELQRIQFGRSSSQNSPSTHSGELRARGRAATPQTPKHAPNSPAILAHTRSRGLSGSPRGSRTKTGSGRKSGSILTSSIPRRSLALNCQWMSGDRGDPLPTSQRTKSLEEVHREVQDHANFRERLRRSP